VIIVVHMANPRVDFTDRGKSALALADSTSFDRGSREAIHRNLRGNGATPDEIEFLLEQRVELNAIPSDELIVFIRRKLDVCGIKKIIPSNKRLAETYQLFVRGSRIEESIRTALEREQNDQIEIPSDLREQVRDHLKKHPEEPWEMAVREIARCEQ
jgi:hypothetical protein